MEDRKKLVEKLRVIANRIERNRLDYRYACDRIILDDLYEELNQIFNDYLKEEGQSFDPMVVDEKEIEYIKLVSYHRQKFSGHKDKIVFYEMDSIEASKKVEDKSLDFIFIDSYCSFEQAKDDIKVWYPKVKDGGIFAGHDWNIQLIQLAVMKFRESQNIKSRMSTYNDTWIWYK